MIHLYFGDGKGKTTAACGLAVRAAGSGIKVLFVQFFKDGSSSEIPVLSSVSGIECRFPAKHYGRYRKMNQDQQQEIAVSYRQFFDEVTQSADRYGMIVLDELVSAYNYGALDKGEVIRFLQTRKDSLEIVLTGRDPREELLALSDYATQMHKVRHPYDRGVLARKGIEY